jgi:hypothetical protein
LIKTYLSTVYISTQITHWVQTGITNNFTETEIRNKIAADLPALTILSDPSYSVLINTPISVTSDKLIYSDQEIRVGASLTTYNGAKLIVRSKKGILFHSLHEHSENIIFEVGDNTFVSKYPQKPVSLKDVQTFCDTKSLGSASYKADQFKDEAKMINPSVDHSNVGDELQVFPNPTSNIINISCNESILATSIFDISGKSVYSSNSLLQIHDVSLLNPGVYFVRCRTVSGYLKSGKFQKFQ